MRLVALLVLAGCAAGTSHIRDPEGRPLPTSARIDADLEPPTVWCEGRAYTIVEPPPPYMTGNGMGTSEVHIRDAAALCDKIRGFDQ